MSRVLTPADLPLASRGFMPGEVAIVSAALAPTKWGRRLAVEIVCPAVNGRRYMPYATYWPSPRSKLILDAAFGTDYPRWAGKTFPLRVVRQVLNPFTRTRRDVLTVAPADEWESLGAYDAGRGGGDKARGTG
jgi:hypothetical protein